MRKTTKLGAVLMTTGAAAAVAAVDAAGHGAKTLTVSAGLLSGACTALGVTSVITGWATRRPEPEDVEV